MHQVIIECPTHRRHLTELTAAEIEVVLHSYRDRLRAGQRAGQFAYGLIFKNSGRDAGMSREHVHSQFIGLPSIPPLAWMEVEGSRRFYQRRQRCVFCHLGDQASSEGDRLLCEGGAFLAYCPFASRVPYEMWIQPKRHEACFTDASDSSLQELATLLRQLLRRMESLLGRVAYNYLIQSRPFDSAHDDHYHWHIVILPRTNRLAGLEWGTGLLVNTVAPERAARDLRELALV
jgi:UDPglucose--hexose-1-phosphate uridylyltransferase